MTTELQDRNVLISSAGRRAGLIECFRASLGGRGRIIAADCSLTAPALRLADSFIILPRCDAPDFVDRLLDLCVTESICAVVPTIDAELPAYAAAETRLAEAGIAAWFCGPETIRIASDKALTNKWLARNGFPTVRQTTVEAVSVQDFPVIVKPRYGSASVGVRIVQDRFELEGLGSEYVVEEIAEGPEYTINAYVSRDGRCVCAVPHLRIEVRAGEVAKGVTVKDAELMCLARKIAEALPDARGPINIQCKKGPSGPKVFEINARFGGGFPLAYRAGAVFPTWLLDELNGKEVEWFDGWMENLAMLRFDDAVYLPGASIGIMPYA